MIKFAGKTEQGKRKNNEDYVAIVQDKRKNTMAVVCDGVGGNKAGEIASEVVVTELTNLFKRKSFIDPDPDEVKMWLLEATKVALGMLMNIASDNEDYSNMSTTITACVVTHTDAVFITAGDSRAYVMVDDVFKKITRDHNVKNLGTRQMKSQYNGEVLVSVLGNRDQVIFDIHSLKLSANKMTILLCSDGIHGFLKDHEIYKTLKRGTLNSKCEKLVSKALKAGSNDNMSCAIVRIN